MTEAGWLVYLRSGDLYVGALDGTVEHQLTSGLAFPDVAGFSRDASGVMWVYFTGVSQRTDDGGGSVIVARQGIDGHGSEELFTFHANVQEISAASPTATVSADGRYIAYADDRGLRLYDVSAQTDRSLLSNRPPSANNPGSIYLSPLWAPAGGWLVVTRTASPPSDFPELDFIRPLEPVTEYTADAGGAFRTWNPDGTQLCASHAGEFTKGYTSDSVGLVVPGQSQFQTVLGPGTLDEPGAVPTIAHPNACAWSADGRVAVSYGIERANGAAVTVFTSAGAKLSTVTAHDLFAVIGWLPSGLGLVRSVEGENVVLMLDGSVRRVQLRADRLVAVLPEP